MRALALTPDLHAIIGTFNSGKTYYLLNIAKDALRQGTIPICLDPATQHQGKSLIKRLGIVPVLCRVPPPVLLRLTKLLHEIPAISLGEVFSRSGLEDSDLVHSLLEVARNWPPRGPLGVDVSHYVELSHSVFDPAEVRSLRYFYQMDILASLLCLTILFGNFSASLLLIDEADISPGCVPILRQWAKGGNRAYWTTHFVEGLEPLKGLHVYVSRLENPS